jgi:predicted nucleotidyltransferase component of viral defense system
VAGKVSHLCERDDFSELVVDAGGEIGIDPAIVEKDYYVTETLRVIADRFGDLVLFKGGTSLSKGWKLLDRFSEDIDLYVQEDHSSSRATKRRLKSIRQYLIPVPETP